MQNNTEAISIEKILSNEEQYVVPIYQRNYEWEKPQISKLIQDINHSSEAYYLGTLVTFKRGNTYELIDGQQRHTTLNLIKAVLGNKDKHINLKFQARPECDYFLQIAMENNAENLVENERSASLAKGIRIIKDVFKEEEIDEKTFWEKFYKQTFLFRTELPEKTDLNHYFEIMNNRGEQLEKHEILKAKMMGATDEKYRHTFAKIWDACSDMGNYIWENFENNAALQIIEKIKNPDIKLEGYAELFKSEKTESKSARISELINATLPEKFSQDDQTKSQKYRSVIDFPTFLLYVLNLCSENRENTTFDDKKLLDVFSEDNSSGHSVVAKDFIVKLLYYRFLFDKIIIKNGRIETGSEPSWGIRSYNNKDSEVSTVDQAFTDTHMEKKIEMLQAMFYFSTISNNEKHWLLELLRAKPEDEVEIYRILKENFKTEIQQLDISKLTYSESSAKHFYYFEYMLWEVYYNYLRGESAKKEDLLEGLAFLKSKIDNGLFNNYRFRQLNSKEHLLAQEIADYKECDPETLNSFGNLCLISDSDNSSSSNHDPDSKKKRLSNNNASLKRLVMFNSYDGDTWKTAQIKTHEHEMEKLLKYYQGN